MDVLGDKKLGSDDVAAVDVDGDAASGDADSFEAQLKKQVVHRKLNARQIQLSEYHVN
jgi:hypothetical protein